MKQNDLRPCPWCGATPEITQVAHSKGTWCVECSNEYDCDVFPQVLFKKSEAEAIRIWNTRATDALLAKAAEALEAIEHHHVEQNRLKVRDESRSKTLALVRSVLPELTAALGKKEG